MQVAAQEAVTADQLSVAKCALLELQKMFDEDPNAEPAPGDRAVVLSNLVRIIQETPDQLAGGMCPSNSMHMLQPTASKQAGLAG